MHKENAKKEKKKRTKKQLVFQIITIALIIVAGVGSGFYCGMLYLSSKIPKVNYNAYAEADLLPNVAEALANVEGKSLAEISAVDAFVVAKHNTENSEMYIATASNTLTHNFGKQAVYTYRHKYNNSILVKEISTSSMKSVAKMLKVTNGNVLVYNGTAKSENSAEWADTYDSYTIEKYKETFGLNPLEVVPYIVSINTISEEQNAADLKGKKLPNGNYRFTLSLDTKKSVINYAKEIKYMSGLSSYPAFLQMDVEFEVNSDLKFVSISSIEMYSFSYSGIAVTCSGKLTTNYTYNTIPTET